MNIHDDEICGHISIKKDNFSGKEIDKKGNSIDININGTHTYAIFTHQ